MTTQQQSKFSRLLLKKLKIKQLKSRIAEGRGRKLKCEEFPELPALLEFAFGDGDRLQQGGGTPKFLQRAFLSTAKILQSASLQTVKYLKIICLWKTTLLAPQHKTFQFRVHNCHFLTHLKSFIGIRVETGQGMRHEIRPVMLLQ